MSKTYSSDTRHYLVNVNVKKAYKFVDNREVLYSTFINLYYYKQYKGIH